MTEQFRQELFDDSDIWSRKSKSSQSEI